jgi:hypothetical protein
MNGFRLGVVASLGVVLSTSLCISQPPAGGNRRGPGDREGPPRFELGRVLPPHARDQLGLTKEQEQTIAAIEAEVKAKLNKILTDEQKKKLEQLGPPAPFGPRGPGGQRPGGGGPPGDRQPTAQELNRPAVYPDAGIQWFATLDSARKEAERTGRPMLLVSSAPHCAGVSGIW